MDRDETVSLWLNQFKEGNADAAQPLWNVYFTKMVTLARHRLGTTPKVAQDEEDVVASAFLSFCEGVKDGRFPKLDSRDDLWAVLFTIVVAKAAKYSRIEGTLKRGGGKILHASAAAANSLDGDLFSNLASSEPTGDDATMMLEGLKKLLDDLGDGNLRQIAIWKMEGYSNREIANMIGKSEPTVERKLKLIRESWLRNGLAAIE